MSTLNKKNQNLRNENKKRIEERKEEERKKKEKIQKANQANEKAQKILKEGLNDEIEREKEKTYQNKLEKKFNDMCQLNKWFEQAKKEKLEKKKKEEMEEIKWKQYKKDADKLCVHGCNLYKCEICNRIYPREQLYHYNVCKNKTSNFNKNNKNFGKIQTDICNCGCNNNILDIYNNNYYGKKRFFNNNYKFTNM